MSKTHFVHITPNLYFLDKQTAMADANTSVYNPGSPAEAGAMGMVLVVMFASLFVGFKTPETVVRAKSFIHPPSVGAVPTWCARLLPCCFVSARMPASREAVRLRKRNVVTQACR